VFKKATLVTLSAVLLLSVSTPTIAEEGQKKSGWTSKNRLEFESDDGKFNLRLGFLGQGLFTFQDPDGGDSTSSFRVRRVRPDLRGKLFGKVGFRMQYELVGDPNLLDFYIHWGSSRGKLQAGQFKAPFGRQELTSIAKQQFVDRSISSKRFAPSRQTGVAVLGKTANSKFEYGFGVFNGNGRNKSKDDNDDKMLAGRVVWNALGAYALDETPLDYPSSPRLALGLAVMSNTEGNGSSATDVTRLGGEIAFKVQGFNLIGEFYQETADPGIGSDIDTDGFYLQAGYLLPNKKAAFAVRIAEVSPDVLGPSADQTETGAALNFFVFKHNHQIQLDYRQLEFDANPAQDRDEFRAQVQIVF